MDVRNQDDAGLQPLELTPAREMRRGSVIMVAVCVVLVVAGRLLFWHGDSTAKLAGTVLFFLTMYTIFGLVQLIFGVSFNEYTQNFARLTGKQRLICCAMIVFMIGLLFPTVDILFPGIWDKNLMYG